MHRYFLTAMALAILSAHADSAAFDALPAPAKAGSDLIVALLDIVTGEAITNASVTLSRGRGNEVVSDLSGIATIPGVAAGRYKIHVRASDYEPAIAHANVRSVTKSVVVALRPLEAVTSGCSAPVEKIEGVLRGRISLAGGAYLVGATVSLYDAAGELRATTRRYVGDEYEFFGLVPARYKIVASAPGYDIKRTTVDVLGKNDIEIGMLAVSKLDAPGNLSGVVRVKSSGVPIAGAHVTAQKVGSAVGLSTTSFSDGTFYFGGLERGNYVVRAKANGYLIEFASDFVAVAAGKLRELKLFLEPDTAPPDGDGEPAGICGGELSKWLGGGQDLLSLRRGVLARRFERGDADLDGALAFVEATRVVPALKHGEFILMDINQDGRVALPELAARQAGKCGFGKDAIADYLVLTLLSAVLMFCPGELRKR